MDFLTQYGLFLAKTGTLVLAFLALMLGVISISLWARSQKREQLVIKDLNEQYNSMAEAINEEILEKKQLKQYFKTKKQKEKAAQKKESSAKKIFVLNFEGDLKASAVDHLREEVTALLNVATSKDEVFIKVDSGGGMLQSYGLAASQLARIRARNIRLVVSVDKIAASGGYLMACVADDIYAAPFSIIGSIGVLAQIPNFHEFLKKHHIDFEEITAGEFKRTLSLFGKNTAKGRQKMQEELDAAHTLFKNFVETYRPKLDLKKVATGEYWLGTEALGLGLVDALTTSDDYLLNAHQNHKRIFEVTYCRKETMKDKLGSVIHILGRQFGIGIR
jgi:serine protease SohB